jgi:hypothetical protein
MAFIYGKVRKTKTTKRQTTYVVSKVQVLDPANGEEKVRRVVQLWYSSPDRAIS